MYSEETSDNDIFLNYGEVFGWTFEHLNIIMISFFEHLNIWTFERLNVWTFEHNNDNFFWTFEHKVSRQVKLISSIWRSRLLLLIIYDYAKLCLQHHHLVSLFISTIDFLSFSFDKLCWKQLCDCRRAKEQAR